MHRQMTMTLLISLFVACSVTACGEDPLDANQGNDANGENNQTNNSTNGENNTNNGTECEDDEKLNPVTGECYIENENGANNGTNNDQNNGPDLNDPNLGADDCEDNEVFDEATQQCVDEDDLAAQCGPGNIDGQTCRPDGGVLPGAEVTVEGYDCDGNFFLESTTADSAGYYFFEDIDSGNHEVTITSGSFSITDDVAVYKDETTNLKDGNAKVCLTGTEVNIAVLPGTWDDIAGLLDGMAVEYDLISESPMNFFADIDDISEYDIIFVECGATWSTNPFGVDVEDVERNIRSFVELGNSIYASDFAQTFIQFPIPEAIEFYNDDGTASGPRRGTGSQTVTADVISDDMKSLLDSETTSIYFNTVFAIALEGGPGSQVHFRADIDSSDGVIEDAALMTSFRDLIGGGHVIFTSFHNSAQATGEMQEILEFMTFQL